MRIVPADLLYNVLVKSKMQKKPAAKKAAGEKNVAKPKPKNPKPIKPAEKRNLTRHPKTQSFTKNQLISGNAKGATMNNLSGNNTPCQDSGIGHASSVTSSAPDGSITDTPSPSLDMSLPSTSYHTSGSGLTTLEVDNDNMP